MRDAVFTGWGKLTGGQHDHNLFTGFPARTHDSLAVRFALLLIALLGGALAAAPGAWAAPPPVRHVFVVVLENKNFDESFGANPKAPYLARTVRSQGQLLANYHGTGHFSLGNYLTMISGQSENIATQADCLTFSTFLPGVIGADGQALGQGGVFPPAVKTVADQLEARGLTWRSYSEDMGADPAREAATCGHPAINSQDRTQKATPRDQYATRHNPFVYFRSLIDDRARCDRHVVNLSRLPGDLASAARTPNYVFITPDLCSDGHDDECVDPSQRGGLPGIDDFLRRWVPRITGSEAFKP